MRQCEDVIAADECEGNVTLGGAERRSRAQTLTSLTSARCVELAAASKGEKSAAGSGQRTASDSLTAIQQRHHSTQHVTRAYTDTHSSGSTDECMAR